MPAFNVTSLKNLRPRQSAYYVTDNDGQRGRGRLALKVQSSGNKTFYFQYYEDGVARYVHIGAFTGKAGELPLAREKREEFAALLDQGVDPKRYLADKEAERLAAEAEKARLELEKIRLAEAEVRMGSVKDLFLAYTDNMQREGKRTWETVRKSLEKDATPVLGADTKARDVTVDDIKRVLHAMIDRGARTQANRVRSYLMAAFNFGMRYDNNPASMKARQYGIVLNPVTAVPKQKDAERIGERDLSPTEIQRLFADLPRGGFSPAIQTAIKLCFATGGQRPNEVLAAEWSEFDFEAGIWELPASKTKNKKAHLVPLTDWAMSIILELPVTTVEDGKLVAPPEGGYLFPNQRDPGKPMLPTSMSKALFRYCRGDHVEEGAKNDWRWEPFVPRDIRRTCKTRMGALRISKDIRDRINNHASNDVSAKHYDRYDYLNEKREALETWCDWLRGLTDDEGKGARKVVPLFG